MSCWILGKLVLGGVCSGLGVGRGTESHLLIAMQVTPLREERLAGCMVMLETRPGQLNLTFIMGKGISLYVADMAGRKEADLNPHTPRVGSYLLLLSRSVMSDSATP